MPASDSGATAQLKACVAYIALLELEKGSAYRGGALVLDDWGKPVEFRCTAPVRPNAIQRTLYGATLLPHIAVELIAMPST